MVSVQLLCIRLPNWMPAYSESPTGKLVLIRIPSAIFPLQSPSRSDFSEGTSDSQFMCRPPFCTFVRLRPTEQGQAPLIGGRTCTVYHKHYGTLALISLSPCLLQSFGVVNNFVKGMQFFALVQDNLDGIYEQSCDVRAIPTMQQLLKAAQLNTGKKKIRYVLSFSTRKPNLGVDLFSKLSDCAATFV